ncbi:unnamed protein product [Cuscuta campestris]|uniref:Uncharacterized protein n=1 Tax=Cuscuta campestris TaxID=132261 RepID=A0A484N5M6_9ASTE|nr:unnamed protein product [Cuscuta campestris]VFQ96392.1 unnamed protein product [Cuscuta campestris]
MLRNNVDEEKKLKLNQPILSVRRISSSPKSSKDEDKKDKENEPVRSPGVVPFVWEDSPGKPKSSPGDRTVNVRHQCFDKAVRRRLSFTNVEEQQETNFVFFKGSHATDRTNPHTKDFMIGLFLPANKGKCSEMPIYAPRNQGPYQGPRRIRRYHQSHDFKGEDNAEVQTNGFPPKVFRGVPRFCVRSSIFIVNPISATSFRRAQKYSFAHSCTRVNNERPKGDVTKQISDALNTSHRFAASVGLDAMRTCKKFCRKLQDLMAADRPNSMQEMEKSSTPETDSPRMTMNEQDEDEEEFAADFTFTDDDDDGEDDEDEDGDDDDDDDDGAEREEYMRNRENLGLDLQTSSYRFDEDEERCVKEEMRSRKLRHSADLSFEFPVSPPPLPESPSESWLSRTLPSLSAKSAPSTPRRLPFRYPTAKPSESLLVAGLCKNG